MKSLIKVVALSSLLACFTGISAAAYSGNLPVSIELKQSESKNLWEEKTNGGLDVVQQQWQGNVLIARDIVLLSTYEDITNSPGLQVDDLHKIIALTYYIKQTKPKGRYYGFGGLTSPVELVFSIRGLDPAKYANYKVSVVPTPQS